MASKEAERMMEEHPGSLCHVTDGGSTVAIEPNGNIWGMMNHTDDTLRTYDLVRLAVEHGGLKLNSYDGNHTFFVSCGFEPVSWCEWDEDEAPTSWRAYNCKTEDVIYYVFVGEGNVNPDYIDVDGFKAAVTPAKNSREAWRQQERRVEELYDM